MRVLCLNSDWEAALRWGRFMDWLLGKDASPVDGGIYNVVGVEDSIYYVLEEFKGNSYRKECFMPLSEIDELELTNHNLVKQKDV